LLHQIPHCQAFLHIGCGVHLPTRTDSQRLLVYHCGSERDVGRNDKIMRCYMRDDVTINFVRFRRNAHKAHQGRRWKMHRTIGHETDRDLSSPRHAKDQLLDGAGTRIGVYPDAWAGGTLS
jgi:hypothetical protein